MVIKALISTSTSDVEEMVKQELVEFDAADALRYGSKDCTRTSQH